MADLVGSSVLVTLNDSGKVYEGILQSVGRPGDSNAVLTFSNVRSFPSKTSLPGLVVLRRDEIMSMKLLSKGGYEDESADLTSKHRPEDRRQRCLISRSEHDTRHVKHQFTHNRSANSTSHRNLDGAESSKLLQLSALPARHEWMMQKANNRDMLPCHFFVVDTVDGTFDEVMFRICSEPAVGVAFEGARLGRHGTPSWMQVSTPDCIYLFDILQMKEESLQDGLAYLLQSPDIVKVIHDCRYISDMLFHHFKVTLKNVFDTQVADMFVYRNSRGGDFPGYTNHLSTCLRVHLGLAGGGGAATWGTDVSPSCVRAQFEKEDESQWLERPAQHQRLCAAAESVLYLLKLHKYFQKALMEDFHTAVDAYLSDLRGRTNVTIEHMTSPHLIPPILRSLFTRDEKTRRRLIKPSAACGDGDTPHLRGCSPPYHTEVQVSPSAHTQPPSSSHVLLPPSCQGRTSLPGHDKAVSLVPHARASQEPATPPATLTSPVTGSKYMESLDEFAGLLHEEAFCNRSVHPAGNLPTLSQEPAHHLLPTARLALRRDPPPGSEASLVASRGNSRSSSDCTSKSPATSLAAYHTESYCMIPMHAKEVKSIAHKDYYISH